MEISIPSLQYLKKEIENQSGYAILEQLYWPIWLYIFTENTTPKEYTLSSMVYETFSKKGQMLGFIMFQSI